MKKIKLLIFSIFIIFFAVSACARKATDPNENKVMQFIFRVRGEILLNRSDITYYVVFYAPRIEAGTPLNPSDGPRVNAPDVTKGTQLLEGRLPFIGNLPGDTESKWTDFFYITSAGGRTEVGRGRKDDAGNPVIYDRNYTNQNTKPVTDSTGKVNGFQIEFFTSSLNNGMNDENTQIITANMASSDSIDSGIGMIYDNWRNNTPFTLSLTSEVQQSEQDINPALVMRQVVGRPDPVLPLGVNPDDVNIIEYVARVTE